MTAAGAKATRRLLHDEGANPPVYAKIGHNGNTQAHVVHVTFGLPKPVDHHDKDGNMTRVTMPKRPRPYTVS